MTVSSSSQFATILASSGYVIKSSFFRHVQFLVA